MPTLPNLLVILPDQMRLMALSLWRQPGFELPGGGDPVDTPQLDRLARESLVLTRAVSNCPICSPWRAMFLSGLYPHANGVLGNCNSSNALHGIELAPGTRCWSDVLADHGYRLGYIGKWHLDAPHEPWIPCDNNVGPVKWNEWTPPERRHGFTEWYAYGTYDRHLRPMYWRTDAPRDGFHYVDQWGPEHEADRAIAFLRDQDPDRPFALLVAMNPPHTDYGQVPERLLAAQRGRELLVRPNIDHPTLDRDKAQREAEAYFAMVQGVDEQVGRILACLDATGLAQDTLVLFTSDHGCCLHSHREGFKGVAWDEALLVPCLLRGPGLKPRLDHDTLLSAPDLMPTLLGLLGLADRIPAGVQGRDLSRPFCGGPGTLPDAALFLRPLPEDPAAGQRGLRTRDHLLLADPLAPAGRRCQLYDCRSDPWQRHDLAPGRPDLVQHLLGRMRTELARAGDPWRGLSDAG